VLRRILLPALKVVEIITKDGRRGTNKIFVNAHLETKSLLKAKIFTT